MYHNGRSGSHVEGVFGLDNRKMAKPNISSKKRLTLGDSGHTTAPLTPPQVAKLYGFRAVSYIAKSTAKALLILRNRPFEHDRASRDADFHHLQSFRMCELLDCIQVLL